MGSTRLAGKPLADIAGLPMVVRVARRAMQSGAARVVVCADDMRILEACARHGVEALATDAAHPTGTDRLAQAAALLGLEAGEIVVNVQGDEPLLPPAVIARVARTLAASPGCDIATAAHPIGDAGEFFDTNVVKVVCDAGGRALYFSRAPIPWAREHFARDRGSLPDGSPPLRHIGLYAYRAGFLARYPHLGPAPAEELEKLEQLRALYHGIGIRVLVLEEPLPAGVDTEEDLARVRRIFAESGS